MSARPEETDLTFSRLSPVVETDVFRLVRAIASDGRPVLLKSPVSTRAPASVVRQLEHELAVARELSPAFAVRPISLVRTKGQPLLVLEDCQLPTLAASIGTPLAPERFLGVARGVAAALADLHRRGLVHRDIQPANVFAGAGGEAKLTGFGVASRASRERQGAGAPEIISGTLAYMAPEQTGRMNRSVDSRSDLYALGITFYQLLTGGLPFTASDPMEWVHRHIAFQPEPPCRRLRSVPAPLSDITMKLLAKNAEDRYQTAEGLTADLEECLAQWRRHGRIEPLALGEHDLSDRLMIPEKLYGREAEVQTLIDAFGRVAAGGGANLLLIAGYSGVGKSALVSELHKALVPMRGLFASGKFDQYKRGIPYATLAEAFQKLVHPLLGKGEAELEEWRRAFREALSSDGRLMTDLVPELSLVIGEQPPVPPLDPPQAKARFELVLRRFIGVFARPEHPLVLFLDDLQWLDAETLHLMAVLLSAEETRDLLVVGAYRDNEVGPDHPLTRSLAAIRGAGGAMREIVLAPLTRTHLERLVADALRCPAERARALAQLVHDKTAGNPFFAIQFLCALADEGLLVFDHAGRRWSWDVNRIRGKGYTDNLADLMVGKIARLPGATQEALQQLACLGNRVASPLLSLALNAEEEDIARRLSDAVDQGLVQKLEGSYRFVHDRVQEAAYSSIPEAARAETHLRIGRRLASLAPPEAQRELVFEVVSQLNRATSLITAPEERDELAGLNLMAARRAKAAAAYASALTYAAGAGDLVSDDRWDTRHDLAFATNLLRAECEFLTGFHAAAEERLAALATHATGAIERAEVARMQIDLYTTLGQNSRAVAVGLDYLRTLGIDWSPHPTKEQARREYERIWVTMGTRAIEELVDLPPMGDPAALAMADVLNRLTTPAMFTDVNLFGLVACRAVNASLAHGNSDSSCVAYVMLGMVAGPQFADYEAGFRFGRVGCELVDRRGLKRFQAATYMTFAHLVMPWTKHVRAGRDLLVRAVDAATKIGDLTFAGFARINLMSNLFSSGDPLAGVQREAEESLRFVQSIRFGQVTDVLTAELALIRSLRGETRALGSFDSDEFDEGEFSRRLSSRRDLAVVECFYAIRALQARIFAGDVAGATAAAERAERLVGILPAAPSAGDCHFFGALAHAAASELASDEERRRHEEALASHHERLHAWAKNCPENFAGRAALVAAERARLAGQPVPAMRLYQEAIEAARASGFLQDEALGNELAGRFYLTLGLEKNGACHLRDAHACYAQWEADAKAKQLRALYPWVTEGPPSPRAPAARPEQLDAMAIVKAQRAISGRIVHRDLAETLLRIVMESAGAQTGYLSVEPATRLVAIVGENRAIEFHGEPPPSFPGVACSILNYVKRTRNAVLLADAARDAGDFADDAHIARTRPRSVFCVPIVLHTSVLGAVYLENNLAAGAFTEDRRAVVEALASQAAISLENARIYAAVQESEAKYRRIVSTAAEGILTLDPEGAVTFANASLVKMLGVEERELVGRSIDDFVFEEDRVDHAERLAAQRKGAAETFERRFRRQDGQTVWTLVSATPIDDGARGFAGSLAMLTEITERKRAEEVLAEQYSTLRSIIEGAGAPIFSVDRGYRYTSFNQAHATMMRTQYGTEIGAGRCLLDFVREAEREATQWRLDRALSGEAFVEEAYWGGDAGTRRFLQVSHNPIRTETGEVIGAAVLAQDLTERKRAEEGVLRLNQDLEQRVEARTALLEAANKELEAFAYSVSHDLRAPLRHIAGFAKLLQEGAAGANLDAKSQHYLATIQDAVGRMGVLIDDLLSFSRMGRVEMARRRVDLAALTRDVVSELAPDAAGRAVDWRVAELPAVTGDQAMLRVLLMNLLSNALKFTRPRERAEIELGFRPDVDEKGVFYVRDNGVGFDMRYVDKLFGVFQRLHLATDFEGTGIGLANVRRIVERHGGRAWAEGALDRGATIYFSLPLASNRPPEDVR
jgi:PAS domain S-box-containing protein